MDVTLSDRANARRVAQLVGGRYISWPKDVGRRRIIRSLGDVKPDLVLDLWGGGVSATAITSAGLNVLSVEDGRSFDEFGVTAVEGRRALSVSADLGGYEHSWGDAIDHAERADAAFLDFMGHWCPSVKETLIACRHMKAVAITLMPERTPLGRLDEDDWAIAYRALLESALQMKVRWVYAYRRNDQNQRATVFFLRPTSRGTIAVIRECMDCGGSLRGFPPQQRRCRDCKALHERVRHQTDAAKERMRRTRERHIATHGPRVRTAAENAENLRKQRERYATDPDYREEMKRRARDYGRGHREQERVAKRAWYLKNRDAILTKKREAAVSGTTAEAICIEEAA